VIHIRRDRTGDQVRLECDGCGRRSRLRLFGLPRVRAPWGVSALLRQACRPFGWAEVHAGDLCPRCARKVGAVPRRPGGDAHEAGR